MSGTTGGGPSLLRRMLGDSRRPKPPPLTVHRAFRLALGQLADERLDIAVDVRGIEDQRLTHSAAGATRLDQAVYFLVEGATGGAGLAIASRDLIAALIEVQTTGRVSDAPGQDRAPTPTDAAMVEGYLDAVLVRLGTMLSAVEGEEWTQGQRLGRPVFDLHQIALELPDIPYRMLRATLGFGAEGKVGELVIILPTDPSVLRGADLGAQAAEAARVWKRRLHAVLMESPVDLLAVLHRPRMSVAAIRALKIGDLVPVPARAARGVRVEGSDRRMVAVGRLGMAGGQKAIRLTDVGPDAAPLQEEEPAHEPRRGIDLDSLGLGNLDAALSPPALNSPVFSPPVTTPEDLPDIGAFDSTRVLPALPAGSGLSEDGTIPLDELQELDRDLPAPDVRPMTVGMD